MNKLLLVLIVFNLSQITMAKSDYCEDYDMGYLNSDQSKILKGELLEGKNLILNHYAELGSIDVKQGLILNYNNSRSSCYLSISLGTKNSLLELDIADLSSVSQEYAIGFSDLTHLKKYGFISVYPTNYDLSSFRKAKGLDVTKFTNETAYIECDDLAIKKIKQASINGGIVEEMNALERLMETSIFPEEIAHKCND